MADITSIDDIEQHQFAFKWKIIRRSGGACPELAESAWHLYLTGRARHNVLFDTEFKLAQINYANALQVHPNNAQ